MTMHHTEHEKANIHQLSTSNEPSVVIPTVETVPPAHVRPAIGEYVAKILYLPSEEVLVIDKEEMNQCKDAIEMLEAEVHSLDEELAGHFIRWKDQRELAAINLGAEPNEVTFSPSLRDRGAVEAIYQEKRQVMDEKLRLENYYEDLRGLCAGHEEAIMRQGR